MTLLVPINFYQDFIDFIKKNKLKLIFYTIVIPHIDILR